MNVPPHSYLKLHWFSHWRMRRLVLPLITIWEGIGYNMKLSWSIPNISDRWTPKLVNLTQKKNQQTKNLKTSIITMTLHLTKKKLLAVYIIVRSLVASPSLNSGLEWGDTWLTNSRHAWLRGSTGIELIKLQCDIDNLCLCRISENLCLLLAAD